MFSSISSYFIRQLAIRQPYAAAQLKGSPSFPDVHGTVEFRQTPAGVLVTASVGGLPEVGAPPCAYPIFALHIHSGGACTGTPETPFADAQGHYNPNDCPHPFHSGDLPPLFSSGGYAWYSFLSGRFNVSEVVGRTVILHQKPDDFTTQPSGNAGEMIACGVIHSLYS